MNKNKVANIIAFLLGLYFIVRAYFWYRSSQESGGKSIYIAGIYLFLGIIAFSAQIYVNSKKKKKGK